MALSVTDFIVERLLEFDPTFDTGGGIATTALMIKPLSVVMQPLRDELDEIQTNQSILSVLESEIPDDFDEDVVDALASNVFIDRKTGGVSSGTVRVRYFSPQDEDIGTGLAAFLDSAGTRVINVNPVAITEAEMGLNIEGSLFYVDIPVESEAEGISGNIDAGGIQTFENEPPNVANVTNLVALTGATVRETNTELIDRIKVAVTVRALVTGRGIITTMQDNFSSIEEINPVGMGEPEMQRDIVFNVHVGGHVDVWVKTPALIEEEFDVVSVIADTTRRTTSKSGIVFNIGSPTQQLRHSGLDRSVTAPIVRSSDGFQTFVEGALIDFTIDDLSGNVTRVASSAITQLSGTTGVPADGIQGDEKTLVDGASPWTFVRPNMQLKVTAPVAAVGIYSVKTVLAGSLTIFGNFPTGTGGTGSIAWEINDPLTVTYDYNPIAIDIIKSVRSAARTDYTITATPVMRIKSIEVLDPSTLLPTGTFLDSTGGYGQGPYGAGSYGIGTSADWVLRMAIPNLRFSADEDGYIDIVQAKLGFSLRVLYETATEITTYQDYVDDTQNNVEAATLKVKHFIPVYVSTGTGGLTYRVKASNTSALSATDMLTAVNALVEGTKIQTNLELSDIVNLLYNNGADQVDLDFVLRGVAHHTDGDEEIFENTAEGILEIPTNLPTDGTLTDTDKPLSQNIAHFMADVIVLDRITT